MDGPPTPAINGGVPKPPNAALLRLAALVGASGDVEPALSDALRIGSMGVAAYNEAEANGDHDRAAAVIAALTELFPDSVPLLQHAVRANTVLNRRDLAEHYATRLLAHQPGNVAARAALIEQSMRAGDHKAELEHRVVLARHLKDLDAAIAVKQENLMHALNGLLCMELDDPKMAVANELLSYDDPAEVDDPYVRSMIDAIDLTLVQAPSPSPQPWPKLVFAAADGRTLTLADLKELTERRRTEVVLLVAADDAYALRYGSGFAHTALRSADISCLVVIIIAGKADELRPLVAQFGIDDERVVFASDQICPSRDQYHSYFAGIINKRPSAYYQCLRFMWLGYVVETLCLPTLVCDIDLVVQHGIGAMFHAHADDDVVFHRYLEERTVGSHIIANLLLVKPTVPAIGFARFLRHYAAKSLERKYINMFVDQITLLMGWHHLQRIPQARIGYFGPYDINKTMFNMQNIVSLRDEAAKFRFLNFFAGQGDTALCASALGNV